MAKAEARVRDTTVWSVRRAYPSASTLIPVRTGSSGRPLVPMAGPLRWAVDSEGLLRMQLRHRRFLLSLHNCMLLRCAESAAVPQRRLSQLP